MHSSIQLNGSKNLLHSSSIKDCGCQPVNLFLAPHLVPRRGNQMSGLSPNKDLPCAIL